MRRILLTFICLVFTSFAYAGSEVNYNNDANCMGSWRMHDTGNETDLSGEGGTLTESGGTIALSTERRFGQFSRAVVIADTEWFEHANNLSTDIVKNGGDQPMSIVCWYKSNTDTGQEQVLVAKYDSGVSQRQYLLRIDSALLINGRISFDGTGGGDTGSALGATTLTVGTPHHVAMVYDADGDEITLFLDGSEDTGGDNPKAWAKDSPHPSTSKFTVGAYYENNVIGNYLNGLIDDVGIFDRVLSDVEVSDISKYGMSGRRRFL